MVKHRVIIERETQRIILQFFEVLVSDIKQSGELSGGELSGW